MLTNVLGWPRMSISEDLVPSITCSMDKDYHIVTPWKDVLLFDISSRRSSSFMHIPPCGSIPPFGIPQLLGSLLQKMLRISTSQTKGEMQATCLGEQ